MTFDQGVVFGVLAGALALFVWGRWRYDIVAITGLVVLAVAGIVPADRAFDGFAHPAVITVVAILVLSRALQSSQLVDLAAKALEPLSGRPIAHTLALTGLVAICSSFMNNVGALALLLPVALHSAYAAKRAPSELLMPLSFGSLLGGLLTQIGTPPNIIVANLREDLTGEPFGMFDFTPVGAGVAIVGVLFIGFVGWRLLPKDRKGASQNQDLFRVEDYISEVRILERSPLVGERLASLEALGQNDIAVVALVRKRDRMLAPSGFMRLQADDILMIEADPDALKRLVEAAEIEVVGTSHWKTDALRSERVAVIEAVVAPGGYLERRTARGVRLHTRHGLNLLGVARQGQPITERLGRVRFLAGDVLLLQGEHEAMPDALANLGLLPLAHRKLQLGQPSRTALTPLVFAAAVATMAVGLLAPQVAFVAAVLVLVLTKEIALREVYEAIDWPVVVLLGAMIPIGLALESTGGTLTLAAPILGAADYVPVWAVLTLLLVVTMLLSDVMNNAATAVLMTPIAFTIASGLELSPDPFLMTVAVGASCTFLTPIGHQSNLLVMGPGGYRFGDYWRMGLPLDALIVAVTIPLILVFWPM